ELRLRPPCLGFRGARPRLGLPNPSVRLGPRAILLRSGEPFLEDGAVLLGADPGALEPDVAASPVALLQRHPSIAVPDLAKASVGGLVAGVDREHVLEGQARLRGKVVLARPLAQGQPSGDVVGAEARGPLLVER